MSVPMVDLPTPPAPNTGRTVFPFFSQYIIRAKFFATNPDFSAALEASSAAVIAADAASSHAILNRPYSAATDELYEYVFHVGA